MTSRSGHSSLSHALRVYNQRHPLVCFFCQLKDALTRTKRVPSVWLAVDQDLELLVLWILQGKLLAGTSVLVNHSSVIATNLELDFRNMEASRILRDEHVRLGLEKATDCVQSYRIARTRCVIQGDQILDGGRGLLEDICLGGFHLLHFSLTYRLDECLRRYKVMLVDGLEGVLSKEGLIFRNHRRDTVKNGFVSKWFCSWRSVSAVVDSAYG